MSIAMALLSPPIPTSHHHHSVFPKPNFTHKPSFLFRPAKPFPLFSTPKASTRDSVAGAVTVEEPTIAAAEEGNGAPAAPAVAVEEGGEVKVEIPKFVDPRWIGGTWDSKQFVKDGKTYWDAVNPPGARRGYPRRSFFRVLITEWEATNYIRETYGFLS